MKVTERLHFLINWTYYLSFQVRQVLEDLYCFQVGENSGEICVRRKCIISEVFQNTFVHLRRRFLRKQLTVFSRWLFSRKLLYFRYLAEFSVRFFNFSIMLIDMRQPIGLLEKGSSIPFYCSIIRRSKTLYFVLRGNARTIIKNVILFLVISLFPRKRLFS